MSTRVCPACRGDGGPWGSCAGGCNGSGQVPVETLSEPDGPLLPEQALALSKGQCPHLLHPSGVVCREASGTPHPHEGESNVVHTVHLLAYSPALALDCLADGTVRWREA